ncbi:trifunctional transcriptional activator/DNA repair protein Ada/methylated-DNA--[protein]-cysteine S-methyltransferase [Paracoccus sp. CPCC 101403]|uniref:Trifunctional transcriptional activator/DNA repair protein Ada/methylated-DNA--[protein]-cysteine S-methyltransferase n=1 Tax=Paracoccus broussonetiae TaxID=3075834 RepID=A0ABU3EDZ9_9RHOB|nr:trifunctional transcriptional activator/DNA repair protein Ada/methylated-DNA--[protein]-cysteine S-methyltransferase [Paracoccus sp. CPCC 101403]MDT1062461.1 trifunctional transcriptional activator/DNA repair protein Ada/methylated-DNA--[protein]-cysteine S-methyltransferase [Paracoccus sp. CPCC 101403]
MLFDLPDHDTLYQALLSRDARFDGQAYVCVASTGVFCRLTCPARKPLSTNCTFRATIGECIEAGFRPCLRCHPLQAAAGSDPTIAALLRALDDQPGRRWSEQDLKDMGHDLSTVRRSFRRHFGMTFLEMARQRRLREGFETLSGGGPVIAAQVDAGFESASAFRVAFARILGAAPAELAHGGHLRASWIPTPLGDMVAVASDTHLHLLEFVDRKALPTELQKLLAATPGGLGLGRTRITEQAAAELEAFFAGRLPRFSTPVHQLGSAFSREVWDELRRIPAGEIRSYADVARRIGRPSATRAVARANGANQIALMVPCHRVMGADGSLTGYGGGLWRKQRLLEIERQYRPMA